MHKTLKIDIYKDPTKHLEVFLNSWLKNGRYEKVENQDSQISIKLIGTNDKQCIMTVNQQLIEITGHIPSDTFMMIDTLAKSCEADKTLEGEVIGKNNQANFNNPFNNASQAQSGFEVPFTMRQFGKITTLSKTKMIILLIIAIPLLIILIPIAIIIAIIKIIRLKLNF